MKLSKKARQSLDKVIQKFQSGDLSPITKLVTFKLDPGTPASRCTFNNRLLAYVQTGDLDCRGYRQWETFGRNVKRGSRAGYILSPKMIKDKDDEEKRKCVGFIAIPVFAASDTEGETPLPDYTPAELPPLETMNYSKKDIIASNYSSTANRRSRFGARKPLTTNP